MLILSSSHLNCFHSLFKNYIRYENIVHIGYKNIGLRGAFKKVWKCNIMSIVRAYVIFILKVMRQSINNEILFPFII